MQLSLRSLRGSSDVFRLKLPNRPEREIRDAVFSSMGDLDPTSDPYSGLRKYKNFNDIYREMYKVHHPSEKEQSGREDFVGTCKAMRARGMKWVYLAMAGASLFILRVLSLTCSARGHADPPAHRGDQANDCLPGRATRGLRQSGPCAARPPSL